MSKPIRKDNLVVIKAKKGFMWHQSEFLPNKFYRSIQLSEGDNVQILVYGEVFNFDEFEAKFEYATERVLSHWKDMSLLKVDSNGDVKPISFTAFGKLADIHTYTSHYGGRRNNIRALYFRTSREVMYGFYPTNVSKLNDVREAYQWYLDTVGGSYEHLDDKSIQFGNCGIPLSYGDLRVWKTEVEPFVL